MKAFLSMLCLLFLSNGVLAKSIENIRVFHDEQTIVREDLKLSQDTIVYVYELDAIKKADVRLNKLITERVGSGITPENVKERYTDAFFEVLNSPLWEEHYARVTEGSKALVYAMRFQIKKLPAIVFNDTDVVYGVTSLREAMAIYETNGNDQ